MPLLCDCSRATHALCSRAKLSTSGVKRQYGCLALHARTAVCCSGNEVAFRRLLSRAIDTTAGLVDKQCLKPQAVLEVGSIICLKQCLKLAACIQLGTISTSHSGEGCVDPGCACR